MLPAVKILMSSYNGEKYICEQLDSILFQAEVNVDIDIRDDGSTDGTKCILQEYATKYSNVHVLSGENVGPCSSFLELLYSAEKGYDYYAFSDQDDIWDNDKISRAIRQIERNRQDEAILYYSALNTFHSDTGEQRLVINEREYSFEETLFQSHYPGCTMVINRKAFDLIRDIQRPSIAIMHDLFIVQVMMCTDKPIIYDKESRIHYRIHGNNVSVKSEGVLAEIKRIWKIIKKQRGLRFLSAIAFSEVINNKVNNGDRRVLEIVIGYRKSIADKLNLIKLVGKTGFSIKIKFAYQLAIIFNFY